MQRILYPTWKILTRPYAHQLNEIRNCFCSIVRANVVVLNPMPYCCNKKHPVGVIFITGGSAGLYIPMLAFAPWAPFACGSNLNATTSLFRGFSSNHRNLKIKCPKGHLIFMAEYDFITNNHIQIPILRGIFMLYVTVLQNGA